jgi:glutamate/tyrosine decarboxylase-like PLP-dependent enzyme
VFVDCDERSWNMDPSLLADAVTERIKRGKNPKAVVLVHLYGQSADLDPIAAICTEHGIPLIEDAAEALGAVYYGAQRTEDAPLLAVANPVCPVVASSRPRDRPPACAGAIVRASRPAKRTETSGRTIQN